MANIKKPRAEKKKVASFSLKTKHLEDFIDKCNRHNIIASHKVEEMIVEFNKSII